MPNLTAIVLAAGASTRMGEENKLLLPFRGRPLLCSVVDAVSASPVDDVVVVTGYEDRQIRDALEDYPIRVAYNPEYESGMATSIRRGIIASPMETSGYVMCLGDMPFVTNDTIRLLCDAFDERPNPSIVVASSGGRRTHPVVLHRDFRDELMQLQGDTSVKPVVDANPDAVVEVEVENEAILADVDTPETYDEVRAL